MSGSCRWTERRVWNGTRLNGTRWNWIFHFRCCSEYGQGIAELCACCAACDFSASNASGWEATEDAVDCVIVMHIELGGGAVPAGDVRFFQDLPVSELGFCFAASSAPARCLAEDEFFPVEQSLGACDQPM